MRPGAFPLSAIVGQEELVQALLINAVSPEVGGVLVRGQRGTAKSTAARALAPLLPGSAPLVELPLGTTLDRLVGSIDLGRALAGEHRFEPGLLSRADGGILYVDEVNLLPDHLVDALLDAAATGVVRVEREAVSVVKDARFLLVGTMNAEEGELRPQLVDRFGLGVEVATPADPAVRAEIVRRRLAYEHDADRFAERWAQEETALAQRIRDARERLPGVVLPARELLRITGACAALHVDGVRGDIVTARAARVLAALRGAESVEEQDVRRAAMLALAHRRRRDPLDGHAPDPAELERALDEAAPPEPPEPPEPPGGGPPPPPPEDDGPPPPPPGDEDPRAGLAPERLDAPVAGHLPRQALELQARGRGPAGRRARSAGPGAGAIDTRPAALNGDDLAVVGTLVARLLHGDAEPLREHVRSGREGALVVLVVDASGSMGARRRAARVKGALTEMLRDAYARRDRVAVIAFRDAGAQLLVTPGAPLEQAAAALAGLATGGRTPLAEGLQAAAALVARERMRDPDRRALVLILTDGRLPEPPQAMLRAAAALGRAADAVSVIDTEDGAVRVGLASQIATAAGGALHRLTPTADRRVA
jgi:magnesium chelatase subunit D